MAHFYLLSMYLQTDHLSLSVRKPNLLRLIWLFERIIAHYSEHYSARATYAGCLTNNAQFLAQIGVT